MSLVEWDVVRTMLNKLSDSVPDWWTGEDDDFDITSPVSVLRWPSGLAAWV